MKKVFPYIRTQLTWALTSSIMLSVGQVSLHLHYPVGYGKINQMGFENLASRPVRSGL